MLNLNSIMVGTMQMDVMAKFYEAVFQKAPDMTEDGYKGWTVGSCFFTVGTHSEMGGMTKDPGRIMLNFETNEVKEEFERIKTIEGAVVVKEPYQLGDAWISTMADPDGNYFQLLTPWEADK